MVLVYWVVEEVMGIKFENIDVYVIYLGGGFGCWVECDVVV